MGSLNKYYEMLNEGVDFVVKHISNNPKYIKASNLNAMTKCFKLSLLSPAFLFDSKKRLERKNKIKALEEKIYCIDPFFDEHEATMLRYHSVDWSLDDADLSFFGAPDVPIRFEKKWDDNNDMYMYTIVKQELPKTRIKSEKELIKNLRNQLKQNVRC